MRSMSVDAGRAQVVTSRLLAEGSCPPVNWIGSIVPRSYDLPNGDATKYLMDHFQPTSNLVRLVVDCWTFYGSTGGFGANAHEQSERLFELYPAQFLCMCFVAHNRFITFERCGTCDSDVETESSSHSEVDRLSPHDRGECSYHEHGEDEEERRRCARRWELMEHKFFRCRVREEEQSRGEDSDDD